MIWVSDPVWSEAGATFTAVIVQASHVGDPADQCVMTDTIVKYSFPLTVKNMQLLLAATALYERTR